MKEVEENFAYLRDVLGVKYLPLGYAIVIDDVQMFAPPEPQPEIIVDQILGKSEAVTFDPMGPLENSEISGVQGQFRRTVSSIEKGSQLEKFSSVEREQDLESIARELAGCTRCKLHEGRKTVVFGSGNPKARLMFVGEGPGEQEDIQGLPFVGPAGQLLTKMIEAMGLKREDVYIANVVKCRPPFNRNPEVDEIQTCSPFLERQIKAINPDLIVALGTFAAQTLLQTTERISRLRGRIHHLGGNGCKVVATYHPSYLLRNPAEKKSAWADLKLAMGELRNER